MTVIYRLNSRLLCVGTDARARADHVTNMDRDLERTPLMAARGKNLVAGDAGKTGKKCRWPLGLDAQTVLGFLVVVTALATLIVSVWVRNGDDGDDGARGADGADGAPYVPPPEIDFNVIRSGDGNETRPSLSFTNAPVTGMYARDSNGSEMGFSVNASERLRIGVEKTYLWSKTDDILNVRATATNTGYISIHDTRGQSGYIGRPATSSDAFRVQSSDDLELRVGNHTTDHVTVTGTTRPGDNGLYDLGTSTHKWRDAYVSGRVQVGAGSIAAPSLTFDSAAATGIYRDSSAGLGMTVNGERRVQLTAYETKLYGVGPVVRAYASTNSSWMDFHGTHNGTVTRNGYIGRSSNDNKIFHVYSDDELRLSGSEVSVVGDLRPSTDAVSDLGSATHRWMDGHFKGLVRVGDGNQTHPSLSFTNAAATGIFSSAHNTMHFTTDGVTQMRLFPDRFLPTNPLLRLGRTDSPFLEAHAVRFEAAVEANHAYPAYRFAINGTQTGMYPRGANKDELGLSVNAVERLAIDSAKVRITSTTSDNPLLVTSTFATSYVSMYDSGGWSGYMGRSEGGGPFRVHSKVGDLHLSTENGTYNVNVDGDMMPATHAGYNMGSDTRRWGSIFCVYLFNSSSDSRLKEEYNETGVEPLGLSFVETLRPRTYYFKNYTEAVENYTTASLMPGINEGFFAHEVRESLEAFNATDRAIYGEGDPSNPASFESLSYFDFIPILVRAVKDLAAQVRALFAANDTLGTDLRAELSAQNATFTAEIASLNAALSAQNATFAAQTAALEARVAALEGHHPA